MTKEEIVKMIKDFGYVNKGGFYNYANSELYFRPCRDWNRYDGKNDKALIIGHPSTFCVREIPIAEIVKIELFKNRLEVTDDCDRVFIDWFDIQKFSYEIIYKKLLSLGFSYSKNNHVLFKQGLIVRLDDPYMYITNWKTLQLKYNQIRKIEALPDGFKVFYGRDKRKQYWYV